MYNLFGLGSNMTTYFSNMTVPIPISGPHSGCKTSFLWTLTWPICF